MEATRILCVLALTLYGVSGQADLWNVVGRWSDFTYGINTGIPVPSSRLHIETMPFSTPIGDSFVYEIMANNTVAAWDWKARGTFNWTSIELPGLNMTGTVITTQQGVSEVFYMINPADSKVYAFDPLKRKTPLWTSQVACTGGTPYQRMGLKGSFLVVRCGPDLLVLNPANGRVRKTIRGRTVPPRVPIPFINDTTVVTWKDNLLLGVNVDTTGTLMQFLTALPGAANISSVAAGPKSSLVTRGGSNTVHVIDSTGKLRSSLAIAHPGYPELMDLVVLPTPRVDSASIAYGILVGTQLDLTSTTPLKPVFAPFALNISDPSNATLLWVTPVAAGTPGPQHVVLSNKYMYVTDQIGKLCKGYNRTTGAARWWYNKYSKGTDGLNIHGVTYNDHMMTQQWLSGYINYSQPINRAFLGAFVLTVNSKLPDMRRRRALAAAAESPAARAAQQQRSHGVQLW